MVLFSGLLLLAVDVCAFFDEVFCGPVDSLPDDFMGVGMVFFGIGLRGDVVGVFVFAYLKEVIQGRVAGFVWSGLCTRGLGVDGEGGCFSCLSVCCRGFLFVCIGRVSFLTVYCPVRKGGTVCRVVLFFNCFKGFCCIGIVCFDCSASVFICLGCSAFVFFCLAVPDSPVFDFEWGVLPVLSGVWLQVFLFLLFCLPGVSRFYLGKDVASEA